MRYVLGIDQGGSKTHAVIADQEGRLLGMGKVMVHAIPAPAWTMQCRQLSRLLTRPCQSAVCRKRM